MASNGSASASVSLKPAPLLLHSVAHSRQERWEDRQPSLLYVLALVAVVVGVDVLFFRHQFWERLIVNVGIVLVFAAFYLRFLKRP
jgi:hypothetical protein